MAETKRMTCGVPKLCSHRRISRFAGETVLPTRMTPKNSEVDRRDNVTVVSTKPHVTTRPRREW
jgi:hypothetical protein